MDIGMIGLGRMGANMARRLIRYGKEMCGGERHKVVVWNRTHEKVLELVKDGAEGVLRLSGLMEKLSKPNVIWVMVPASLVDEILYQLIPLLSRGDIIVDGANSNYHDSMRRGKELHEKGILFVDAGVSGGLWGLENGYCIMVGGKAEAIRVIEPVLKTLAPSEGYLHVGEWGAGHFVKMIHNGIEYGMLEAYGEGFELLKASEFGLDLAKVAHLWNQGSVIRSWLLELAERALFKEKDLASVRGYIEDSGEGRWTVAEGIAKSIPIPVITASLMTRFASRQSESWSAKFIAALRNEFGGHSIFKVEDRVKPPK